MQRPPGAPPDAGPPGFIWAEDYVPADDVAPDNGGCRCSAEACERGACPCACAALGRDERGRLIVLPGQHADLELTECGPACACFGGACSLGFSDVSVGGSSSGDASTLEEAAVAAACPPPVSLRQLGEGKGWGVVAGEPLPKNLVICHYAGEFVSTGEAVRRLREYDAAGTGHALLVLRQWLPSGTAAFRINIDATRRGNMARFLNHSCDGGNLSLCLGR